MKHLELAIQFGAPFLFENVDEELDPMLDPVRYSRVATVPSRCCWDSYLTHDAGGRYFVEFEAIRTTSGPSRRVGETAFMKMA